MKIFISVFIILLFILGCTAQQQPQRREPLTVQIGQPSSQPSIPAPQQPTQPSVKEFNIEARQFEFNPSTITVNKGDRVKLNIRSTDVTHGFSLPDFNIQATLSPGNIVVKEFTADKAGSFTFKCSVYCGSGHSDMKGTLIVNQ